MGIISDAQDESFTRFLCELLVTKTKKYPEASIALKEIGIELLNDLPTVPDWVDKYYKIFRS